jgi:hypothetical protein
MDPSYTLDFIISDGGSVLLPLYDNFYNEWSYLPTNSTKTGYNLIGWTINGINVYYDATVNLHYINFFWSVQGNLVAYPIRELKTYDIVFNIEGDIYNKTATYNTLFTVPLPVKSGFTFEGWYNTSSSDLLLNEFIWTWDYNRNFESNWIQNTETSNINNAETFLILNKMTDISFINYISQNTYGIFQMGEKIQEDNKIGFRKDDCINIEDLPFLNNIILPISPNSYAFPGSDFIITHIGNFDFFTVNQTRGGHYGTIAFSGQIRIFVHVSHIDLTTGKITQNINTIPYGHFRIETMNYIPSGDIRKYTSEIHEIYIQYVNNKITLGMYINNQDASYLDYENDWYPNPRINWIYRSL